MILYTTDQGASLVNRYNALVKARHYLRPDQAHLLMECDFFDNDIEDMGHHSYRIDAGKSRSGKPAVLVIRNDEVSSELDGEQAEMNAERDAAPTPLTPEQVRIKQKLGPMSFHHRWGEGGRNCRTSRPVPDAQGHRVRRLVGASHERLHRADMFLSGASDSERRGRKRSQGPHFQHGRWRALVFWSSLNRSPDLPSHFLSVPAPGMAWSSGYMRPHERPAVVQSISRLGKPLTIFIVSMLTVITRLNSSSG